MSNNLVQSKTKKYAARRVAAHKKPRRTFVPIAGQWIVRPGFRPGFKPAEQPPPDTGVDFVDIGKRISRALDPKATIEARLENRIRRFRKRAPMREGEAPAFARRSLAGEMESTPKPDALRPVMVYPEFHRPMYRFLRDLSQEYVLPGLENVPSNTVGLLTTNRRFMEAFMIGLNHEFASELRWREFPTDMRGSYFRKFWDTSIYSVDENEKGLFRDSEMGQRLFDRIKAEYSNWLGALEKDKALKKIEATYVKGDQNDEEQQIAAAYEQAVENWLLSREEEKDIKIIDEWSRQGRLGFHPIPTFKLTEQSVENLKSAKLSDGTKVPNEIIDKLKTIVNQKFMDDDEQFLRSLKSLIGDEQSDKYGSLILAHVVRTESNATNPESQDQLVLLVRGELLQKYSNAIIYLAKKKTKIEDEKTKVVPDPTARVFPIFEGALPPDMSFIGFPISEDQARTGDYFIVFEERMTDLRYGLDTEDDPKKLEEAGLADLSWKHFEGVEAGNYLDGTQPTIAQGEWNSAAFIAKHFVQKQVRVAIALEELMPISVE